MDLVTEQLVVGTFITCLYLVCSMFGLSLYPTLFVTGFFKHFIGYYSGIQSQYCKSKGYQGVKRTPIVLVSVYEGLKFFLLYGFVLAQLGVPEKFVPYVLAFSVHFFAEVIGEHDLFIRERCFSA